AAVIENIACPLGSLVVQGLVNTDAAALVLLVQVVAHADDKLVRAIAIQVGGPDAMSPAELGVHNVAVPHFSLGLGLGVDDNLETVPWLDGGDELLAALE